MEFSQWLRYSKRKSRRRKCGKREQTATSTKTGKRKHEGDFSDKPNEDSNSNSGVEITVEIDIEVTQEDKKEETHLRKEEWGVFHFRTFTVK